MKQLSKMELASALFHASGIVTPVNTIRFADSSGKLHCGTLASVQREDGSGSSFNLTYYPKYGKGTVSAHVRTID